MRGGAGSALAEQPRLPVAGAVAGLRLPAARLARGLREQDALDEARAR